MTIRATDWHGHVKGHLKAELKRKNLSYADLAIKLQAIGVEENERNIANKIARGTFAATFFIQCLHAIGCRSISIDIEDG